MMPLPKPPNAPVLQLFSLKDKAVLVTGGAKGIGLAVAQGYAEAGASVAITYSTTPVATATDVALKVSRDTGTTVLAYQCDVRNRTDVRHLVERVRQDLGRLDVVVANAGVGRQVDALETSEEDWAHIMRTNIDGVFWTAQAAGDIFKSQGYGSLIVTASVSAILVNLPQKQAAYNASKAAAVQLARSLAVEWAGFARVNVVSPGFIETDMIHDLPEAWKEKWHEMVPGVRFCDPYELKGVYVFLASDASSYMTGANLVVDGGYTLP